VTIMDELKIGLLAATVIVIGLVGLAFRSMPMLALAVLPNLIAIMATGALMYVLGQGLTYPGLVAMTVAFGLAADDTIHFLNRLAREDRAASVAAVVRTMTDIGPALVLTSLVLVLGLAVTGLSDLPPNRIFGILCIATLGAALIGDLVLLPASIIASGRTEDRSVGIAMLGRRQRLSEVEHVAPSRREARVAVENRKSVRGET
jgi:uncharacterized protein